jgi:hypothetical protein
MEQHCTASNEDDVLNATRAGQGQYEVKMIVMGKCDNRCLQHGHSARSTGNPVKETASCVHVPRSKTIHHFLVNQIIITL